MTCFVSIGSHFRVTCNYRHVSRTDEAAKWAGRYPRLSIHVFNLPISVRLLTAMAPTILLILLFNEQYTGEC